MPWLWAVRQLWRLWLVRRRPTQIGVVFAKFLIWWRPNSRVGLHVPMEVLHGRPLSPEELEMIRRQIEEGIEVMAAVDDEIRGSVARNLLHLLAKLPPEED